MILIENDNCTDPFINLAIEEYTFRNLIENDVFLFLYINDPSIIIGRNQNPFIEVNPRFLYNQEIPIVRRISGGGTVFHDHGNISFSFIRKFESNLFNNYREFTRPIIETLADLGVIAVLDERNNIRIEGRKISGNAQFTSKNKMLSHGTILFSTELSTLHEALSEIIISIRSKSTPSISSEVTNVSEHTKPDINIHEFKLRLIKKIMQTEIPRRVNFTNQQWNEIHKLADSKYRTWEWNYGETPPFSYSKKIIIRNKETIIDVEVIDGVISSIATADDIHFDYLMILNSFIGCKFREVDIFEVIEEYGRKIPSSMNQTELLKLFDYLPRVKERISNQ